MMKTCNTCKANKICDHNKYGFENCDNYIPLDVAEVKRGGWEACSDEYEICASEFVCSKCKESFVSSELTDEQFFKMMKFCPNCGADMRPLDKKLDNN